MDAGHVSENSLYDLPDFDYDTVDNTLVKWCPDVLKEIYVVLQHSQKI